MGSLHAKPRERSANIFINYRREDSAGHAGRLFDALSSHFPGRLFMDVDTLEPGVDFVEAIEQAVGSCEVLVVIIGREWLAIKDKTGRRRLDDPGDFVRLEVEAALARRIRVIPVLVQDTPMPGAEELPGSLARLARRNAIELSDARWAYDVDRLAHTIQDILEESPVSGPAPAAPLEKATPPPGPLTPGSRVWLLSLTALALVVAVVLGSWVWIGRTPAPNRKDGPFQAPPANLAAVTVPAGGLATRAPASGGPTAEESRPVETASKVEPSAPSLVVAKPSKALARVLPAKTEGDTVPPGNEPSAASKTADTRGSSEPAPSVQPVRVTILSPQNNDTVGSDVLVQGIVFGLGERHIFLCIRQSNGMTYPRGEVFSKDDSQWSIKLRSSKEKTFDVLVVASASKEADQVLRDQRSRDEGLATLPAGASVSSSVVTLKRQGKISSLFNPKR